jgi:antirestriction protein ArdC
VNRDIYQEVTDRIIEELEKGVVPWQSPYFSEIGFPKNFASGKSLGLPRFDGHLWAAGWWSLV